MWKERIEKYRQVLAYMETIQSRGIVLGLDSMKRLMGALGNPQDTLTFVHIAGTNGKGSVLAFVSHILKCAGYRTGRYSSPAVFSRLEQIQVNGRAISKADYVNGLETIRQAAEKLEEEGYPYPTPFEVETALAFWYFREKKCEIVVLECGMGGLTDATNIINTAAVCVLTAISMDHMGMLGEQPAEIAAQKAGIIKKNCQVVCARQAPEVMRVIETSCREQGAVLREADSSLAKNVRYGLERQRFDYDSYDKIVISMAGQFQIENAIVAVETISALRTCGYPVTEKMLRKGLLTASWPGRFCILARRPLFVADGAHNVDAAQKLKESVSFYFTNKQIITIMGILKDKEYEKIVALTAPLAAQVITVTTPGTKRALAAWELAGVVRKYNPNVTAADSLQEAVEMSYLLAGRDSVILALGSLSYLGELSGIVAERHKIRRDTHGRSEES